MKARKATPTGPILSAPEEHYPHVYRSHDAGNTLSAYGNKYSLPIGTTRSTEDVSHYDALCFGCNVTYGLALRRDFCSVCEAASSSNWREAGTDCRSGSYLPKYF
jgi:hypothetical protein